MAEIFKKYKIPSSVTEQIESSIPSIVDVVGVKNLSKIQESVMFEDEKNNKVVDKWSHTMENFVTSLASAEETSFKHKSIKSNVSGGVDRMN